jgi:threonine dehydratase
VIARRIAADQGTALVPSDDHDHIIVGQGTIGIEIADDARRLGLLFELVLIPCGGLSSGCAVALKLRMSRYWII